MMITNDNLAEGTETFSLILQQDPLLGSTGVAIEPNVAEITILDDSNDTCPGIIKLLCFTTTKANSSDCIHYNSDRLCTPWQRPQHHCY